MSAVKTLATAMVKGFLRDRMALGFTLLFPVVFLVFFGSVAGSSTSSRTDLLVVGKPQLLADLSGDAKEAFDGTFKTTPVDDLERAIAKVRDGDADGAVAQRGDRLVVYYSRADATGAAILQGAMQGFVDASNVAATGRAPRYQLVPRQVEDESLRPIQYIAPGLLGWAVATSATFGAALSIVTWRQSELLRRLRLSPVSTRSIVAARVAVSVGVALVQLAMFLVLSVSFFHLQLRGSWWLAVPLVACGTLSFMAIGLFCGSIATTNDGSSGLANLIVLPMAFLSGSFAPLDQAPAWIKAVSHLFPLRYLNEAMLDVMVRGKGIGAAVAPMLILLTFAAVVAALAARLFRWDKTAA